MVLEARQDPAAFIEFAIRHEKTGKRITNAHFHKEWQRFITEQKYGVIVSPVEHGKTQQVAIGRVIWELGNNPNIRIALIGESEGAAKKLLGAIKTHIEENPLVREVFPDLKPTSNPNLPWTSTDICVERDTIAKDPSVQARGIGGSIIGSRLDLAILDDIHNQQNQGTKEQIDKLEEWFDSTVFTRLQDDINADEFGRCFLIGTPWNANDLIHRLKARKGWAHIWYHAVLNPDAHPDDWQPLWERQWPLKRILLKRDGMTEQSFVRKYLTKVRIDAASRFKQAWIDHMKKLGKGRYFMDRQPRGRGGRPLRCITGVDLGIGQDEGHDLTVFFTICIDDRNRRIVIDIESGRFTGPEIVRKIHDKYRRFDSTIVVESNQAQRYIKQFANEEGLPVLAANTGKNKWDENYGVESLAVEVRAGLWVAPSGEGGVEIHPEVKEWFTEMLYFSPSAHTGDRLMASWIAREEARRGKKKRSGKSTHLRR